LKVGKAPGLDGIVTKLLIEASMELSKPLYILFSKPLQDGVVQKDWKKKQTFRPSVGDFTDYVDQGNAVDVIYLDYQKGFDKVPHKRRFSF
jgi:hypothetical protein